MHAFARPSLINTVALNTSRTSLCLSLFLFLLFVSYIFSLSILLVVPNRTGSLLFIHRRLHDTQSFGAAHELWLDEGCSAADLRVCFLVSCMHVYVHRTCVFMCGHVSVHDAHEREFA